MLEAKASLIWSSVGFVKENHYEIQRKPFCNISSISSLNYYHCVINFIIIPKSNDQKFNWFYFLHSMVVNRDPGRKSSTISMLQDWKGHLQWTWHPHPSNQWNSGFFSDKEANILVKGFEQVSFVIRLIRSSGHTGSIRISFETLRLDWFVFSSYKHRTAFTGV